MYRCYVILNINRHRHRHGVPRILLTDIVTAALQRLALLSRITIQISKQKYLDDKPVTSVGQTTCSGDWNVFRRDRRWQGRSLQNIKPVGRVTITIIIIKKNCIIDILKLLLYLFSIANIHRHPVFHFNSV